MKWSLRWVSCFICCFISALVVTSSCQSKPQEQKVYRVIRVIDGDTVKLDNGMHVRLIGIDAPEMRQNPKLERDLQERHLNRRTELAMGKRAYQFTRHLVEGKKVRLEFDVEKYDEYHRLLAYVYLTNGTFVNAEIVKAGYAYVYPIRPNVRYAQLFRQLYREALENHRGLWRWPFISPPTGPFLPRVLRR
ncbi:MAG: thermonuclease family protein [Candidatus Omnitrophica bacterium]|nr:thermonuclease family protein [Candidatus Omnitrophota bacterium]